MIPYPILQTNRLRDGKVKLVVPGDTVSQQLNKEWDRRKIPHLIL